MAKGLCRQTFTHIIRDFPLLTQGLKHLRVPLRIDDDTHPLLILCRRTNHGRTANIDIFNSLLERNPRPGNGLLKGIEIDHHKIDQPDAIVLQLLQMLCRSSGQNTPMNPGMKGLDPPIQNLRKSRDLGNIANRQPRFGQRFKGAAGRNQVKAQFHKSSGKLHKTCFIGDAEHSSTIHQKTPIQFLYNCSFYFTMPIA